MPDAPETKLFRLDDDGRIGVLTLNQPAARNRFSLAAQRELSEIVSALERREDLGGLIVTGAGPAFAAGADIGEMAGMDRAGGAALSRLGQDTFNRIERLGMITVAAINGPAIGGGCELALACDFRIAVADALIGQAEIGIGLIPGWGASRRLPRLIGYRAARDLIFTGRCISGQEALAIGLVDRLAEKDALPGAARDFLNELLRKSPLILRYAKAALRAGITLPDTQAEQAENDLFARCFDTADRTEGMRAFLEKRKPTFKGK
jgi:enoyl-CoA hydratase